MAAFAIPALYAVFVWWFSTGVILYVAGLPRRTWRWSLAGATAVAIWALVALAQYRDDQSVLGAYVGFTAGILLWGWHEVTFLLGAVTGPRITPCPPGSRGITRFLHATEAILYHEIAIVITVAFVIALKVDAGNQVGLWTFMVLWLMRLSAKLNLFLGVPKPHDELLPEHLAFMGTYFRKRTMNALFPLSVTAGTATTVLLVAAAARPGADPALVAGNMLIAALLALAVLEHWFMVLPIHETALWRWALKARAAAGRAPALPPDDRSSSTIEPALGVGGTRI